MISFNVIKAAAIAAALLSSTTVLAQATVRDSRPLGADSQNNPSQSAEAGLFDRLQNLQQEVVELRGLVEEQGYIIKKLQGLRVDDYDEFDRRISELKSGGGTTNVASEATEEEQALYQKAIDQVLEDQDYEGALTSFDEYLKQYPNGALAPDVYYWQGEIYLLQDKTADAEVAFVSLINLYPTHEKALESKFKVANIYIDQKNVDDARPLLEDIVKDEAAPPEIAEQARILLKDL